MYTFKNKSDSNRVGISVSKKVGKANVRNKVRRRIKESYRLNIDGNIKKGYDIDYNEKRFNEHNDLKKVYEEKPNCKKKDEKKTKIF